MFIKGMRIYRMAETGAGTGGEGGGGAGGGTPWFESFDSETKGYLQTRGWDKKTAAEAMLEASKAHREAEKFVGAPADKLLRVPDERTTDTQEARTRHAEEWEKIHQRLGKPKEAKDYDFATVKRAGDKPLDAALTDTLRQAAFDANVGKDGALKLAAAVVKHLDATEAAGAADTADKLLAEKKALNDNWGVNANTNMMVAQGAVKALGIDPTAVAALEKVVGYAKVMEMFRNIGSKIGEDRFVNSQGPGGGIMTKDQAQAEKSALMKDKAWVTRYNNGGVEEGRKMLTLNKIITGTV